MRGKEKGISKTVRLEKGLIEQVTDVLDQEEIGWRRLNFSEAIRYGLVLVLAAHGVVYDRSHFPKYDRIDSVRKMKRSKTLDAAVTRLMDQFTDSA